MRTKIMLSMVIFVLTMVAFPVFAQDFDDEDVVIMPPHKGMMGIPNLTTEQLSKIEKLRLEHQKEVLPIKTKLQAMRLELRSMIMENSDSKKIESKVEEMGDIRTELMKKHVMHRLTIRNLLTDEQKVYFDTKGFGRFGMHGKRFPCEHFNRPGAGFRGHQNR